MEIRTLFNFILSDERSDIFLMSGDFDWLNANVFNESEFYIGMKFTHDGYKYVIDEIKFIDPQNELIFWSNEDHENYYGEPCKANLDIYFKCLKEKE